MHDTSAFVIPNLLDAAFRGACASGGHLSGFATPIFDIELRWEFRLADDLLFAEGFTGIQNRGRTKIS
jgi:hypothetical protein